MAKLFAAEVWHYWLSFAFLGLVGLAVVATFVGYLVKITSNRYPKE